MTDTTPGVDIEVRPAKALAPAEIAVWQRLLAEVDGYAYPSLAPLNVCALAAVRNDVFVAIGRRDGEPVAFFPFTRDRSGRALPAAQWFMSFQGMVAAPGVKLGPQHLIHATGARRIVFDRFLPLGDHSYARYELRSARSSVVDLRNGYEAYRASLEQRGSRLFKRIDRKSRRAERLCESVALTDETGSDECLDCLIAWRQRRNREILAFDFLTLPWPRRYMQQTMRSSDPSFRGRLFVLRFGDVPVAALFALQTASTLECAVTAFDPEYAQFSPGLLLFHAVIRDGASLGIEVIHLTRGTESFKERFGNASTTVADLEIGRSPASHFVARKWLEGQEIVRATPIGAPARRLLRRVRLIRGRIVPS